MNEKFRRMVQGLQIRFGTVCRLLRFLWTNKMWWMIPLVFILVLFFLVIIFAQSSPLGPFIYTLF